MLDARSRHPVSYTHLINADVLKAHIEGCVRSALEDGSEEQKAQKLDEIGRVIAKLTK